jgi:hypothetical protein
LNTGCGSHCWPYISLKLQNEFWWPVA